MAIIYTLVRHSGYTHGGKPAFEHAVEERSLDAKQVAKVIVKGGLVFGDYKQAYDAAFEANYAGDNKSLYPRVPGRFVKVGDLDVYVPPK